MKFLLTFMCFLCQLFAQDQFSQIRCSSCKIKEGCLEEVKAYYQSAFGKIMRGFTAFRIEWIAVGYDN